MMNEFLMPSTAKGCTLLLSAIAVIMIGCIAVVGASDSPVLRLMAFGLGLLIWLQGAWLTMRHEQLKHIERRLDQPEF